VRQEKIVSFRDLRVWQIAMDLAVDCYLLTRRYPKSELYGLTSQTRRAASSIPANIAEGHARQTNVYRNHVRIALGSHAELETVLELAGRLRYTADADVTVIQERLNRVGRMLHRLATSLEPPSP
jgi:four helix bundle protein